MKAFDMDEFEDEVTKVDPITEHRTEFVFSDRDVELIREIADEHGISYNAALCAVLRDALDLYHWNHKRVV